MMLLRYFRHDDTIFLLLLHYASLYFDADFLLIILLFFRLRY